MGRGGNVVEVEVDDGRTSITWDRLGKSMSPVRRNMLAHRGPDANRLPMRARYTPPNLVQQKSETNVADISA